MRMSCQTKSMLPSPASTQCLIKLSLLEQMQLNEGEQMRGGDLGLTHHKLFINHIDLNTGDGHDHQDQQSTHRTLKQWWEAEEQMKHCSPGWVTEMDKCLSSPPSQELT